jgi:hypothetical protein
MSEAVGSILSATSNRNKRKTKNRPTVTTGKRKMYWINGMR